MSNCDEQLLGAYHDGELHAADRQRVEAHLRVCPRCSAELLQLQALSRLIESHPHDELTEEELDRVHTAVEESADRPIFRISAAIATIAASVLIVSGVWLADLSNRPAAGTPAQVAASPEAWETVAVTLQPTPAEMAPPGSTEATADASLADWMLKRISGESN